MKPLNTIRLLVLCISVLAVLATGAGIFTRQGPGSWEYTSIRGETVTIWGKGLYQHMSAEVAPQGIAQDWVTLLLGVPLLLLSLHLARKHSLTGRFLLAGSLGYFLVTYLFYTVMGMYNALFLVYVLLLACSFFAFAAVLLSFDLEQLPHFFGRRTPVKAAAGFLIFVATAIALLWLSIVVPPLLDGSIIPAQTEHYTTLVVQGLDLGLLLPLAVVSGLLFWRKKTLGYLLCPVYYIFLSLLMTALTAKVIAMALLGYAVVPVIFIIPSFNLLTIAGSIFLLRGLHLPIPTSGAPETAKKALLTHSN